MVIEILTAKDQANPAISQWESARHASEEKLSEGDGMGLLLPWTLY